MVAKRKYTKELLDSVVGGSNSVYDVLRKLNVKIAGGSCGLVGRRLREYGIDTSHFVGSGVSRNSHVSWRLSHEKVLVLRSAGSARERSWRLRRALIESGRKYLRVGG